MHTMQSTNRRWHTTKKKKLGEDFWSKKKKGCYSFRPASKNSCKTFTEIYLKLNIETVPWYLSQFYSFLSEILAYVGNKDNSYVIPLVT